MFSERETAAAARGPYGSRARQKWPGTGAVIIRGDCVGVGNGTASCEQRGVALTMIVWDGSTAGGQATTTNTTVPNDEEETSCCDQCC
jgi:hypothetical protein